MRELTIKSTKIGLVVIGVILMITIIALFSSNTYAAYALSLEPNDYDSYTNSDNLLGLDATITNYRDSLESYEATYGQNVVISNPNGLFMNNVVYSYTGNLNLIANIYGDDNITRIIPKDLFANIGSVLYIGEEYGFFIETYFLNTFINVSTVLVFDITNEPDVNMSRGRDN